MARVHTSLGITILLFCITGCAFGQDVSLDVRTASSIDGKVERFTQYELDVAFKRISASQEKLADPEDRYDICCILLYKDMKLLVKIFEHFMENNEKNIDDYGVLVQENEVEYIVHFGERYKEENQFFARDAWWPGTSEAPLSTYRYRVDRETLEILEFQEFPQ